MDEKGEYRWHLKAPNGRIIADSAESYKAKSGCKKGIELMQYYCVRSIIVDLTKKKKRRRRVVQ